MLLAMSFVAAQTALAQLTSKIDHCRLFLLFNLTSTAAVIGNLSTSLVRPSITMSGEHCCNILPESVGLNYWHDTTYTAYPITVITQYLQYNNTVVTNLSTIVGPVSPISVPIDIIPVSSRSFLTYSRSVFNTNNSAVYPETTM
jgi:hypothetical protein